MLRAAVRERLRGGGQERLGKQEARVRPDGGQVAVGSKDGVVTFRHPRTLEPVGRPLDVGQPVTDVAYGPDGSLLPIVCTEPSPDYAIAFGQNGNFNATVTVPEKATVGGGGAYAQTEAVTQLNGRAPAVLALRDGLFAACQAYANGVIGHDAYSMILSQYGTLLVALVAEKPGEAGSSAASARRATLSAMLVACIGRHDGTRIPQGENRLLTEGFCRRVLASGLRHALAGGGR